MVTNDGLFTGCGECCGIKCRTIYLWRYQPGFPAFQGQGTNTTDPIAYLTNGLYAQMAFNFFSAGDNTPIGGGSNFWTGSAAAGYTAGYSGAWADGAVFLYYEFEFGLPAPGDSITSQTATTITAFSGSTYTLSSLMDIGARARSVYDPTSPSSGLGSLTGNFTSLPFLPPFSIVNSGGGNQFGAVDCFTFKDSCSLSKVVFCTAPLQFTTTGYTTGPHVGSLTIGGYNFSGVDMTTGYDHSITPISNLGDSGYGFFCGTPINDFASWNTANPAAKKIDMGACCSASFFCVGLGGLLNVQGLGAAGFGNVPDLYIVAGVSQALIVGNYKFTTYVIYSEGATSFESCATGGFGDGITPIDIPIPVWTSINPSYYSDPSFTGQQPVGRITVLEAGTC